MILDRLRVWLGGTLRRRLAISIALVHAAMMTVFVLDLVDQQRSFLDEANTSQSVDLAETLAGSVAPWVMARDLAGLEEAIRYFGNISQVSYAMVVSADGEVLAHNDLSRIGLFLDDPVSLAMLGNRPEPHITLRSETLIDSAAPIMVGSEILGWARVGLSQEASRGQIRAVTYDGLLYTLLAIALGVVLAMFISGNMTRRLSAIRDAFSIMPHTGRRTRIPPDRSPDEIGQLTRDINQTLEELDKRDAELNTMRERLQLALNGSNDGLWDWDLRSNTLYRSPRWKAILGYAADELGDHIDDWTAMVHPDDLPLTLERVQKHLRGETPGYESLHRLRHKDGHYVWTLARGRALRDAEGAVHRMVGIETDVSELKLLQDNLQSETSRLKTLITSLPDGVLVEDENQNVAIANAAFCRIFGFEMAPEELVGRPFAETFEQARLRIDAPERFLARVRQLTTLRQPALNEYVHLKGGRTLERNYLPIQGDSGLMGHLWTFRDITDRLQLESALHEQKERLSITLHSIGDAVIVLDEHGRTEFMNPAAAKLTGWDEHEGTNLPAEDILHLRDDHHGGLRQILNITHDGTLIATAPGSLTTREGNRLDVEYSAAPISSPLGDPNGAVLVVRDVSESRRMAEQMAWQARHDILTGLHNRLSFEESLKGYHEESRHGGGHHALLYIDLDQFKVVNDTCGHHAGDELLRQLSRHIEEALTPADLFARLGGDEYAILVPDCSPERARTLAEKILQRINNFSFAWEGQSFNIGASIGVVNINPRWDGISDILSAADIALYAAKDRGRNRVHVYEVSDESSVQRLTEMNLSHRIQQALKDDRFVLYAQPIAPTTGDHDYRHAELLVRMLDENDAIVPPGEFIAAAERYDLMPRLDRWIIENAFTTLRKQGHIDKIDCLAINLSGTSLADPATLPFIREQFEEHRLQPERVCFEITETAAITNLKEAMSFIHAMRDMGCRFSLDDFGSGLSSFGYLKNLPVDFLKIDGSFVRDIATDQRDRIFVQVIHQVGHSLGLKTIAEFVESERIHELLRDIGVDYVQGYAIGRPRPLIDWINRR